MLRAPEVSLSALASQHKARLGAVCQPSHDCEASEERSSDDHYDFQRQPVKIAAAEARSFGLVAPTSLVCRAPSRNVCAPWVPAFLAATYFQPCERHRHHKKNECTFFCITCGAKPISVCQHCMGAHAGHQVIQVRRYVYCDVVRTCDITSFVDTTGVQNYIINSAKVMFLNHRPHTKIGRANGVDVCRTCQRHLREGFSYCSLACKVEALTEGDKLAPGALASHPSAAIGAAPCRSPKTSGLPKAASDATTLAISPRTSRSLVSAASILPAPPAGAAAAVAPVVPAPRSGARKNATAGALLVADAGGGAATGGLSSDLESSEPGDDIVLYGGVIRSAADDGLAVVARRPTVFTGREMLRDSYGSASSEDDCCEYNYENPPKRRRSSLIGRRPSNCSSVHEGLPPSAAEAAAAAAAAATLLMPFRSGLLYGSIGSDLYGSIGSDLAAAAAASGPVSPAPNPSTVAAAEPQVCTAAGSSNVSVSRRKRNAPQRAPSS